MVAKHFHTLVTARYMTDALNRRGYTPTYDDLLEEIRLLRGELAKICAGERAAALAVRFKLTFKEAQILDALVGRDSFLSRSAIMEILYPGEPSPPLEKIMDVYLCKIRKKLAAGGVPGAIATVRGHGYQLRDQVREALCG